MLILLNLFLYNSKVFLPIIQFFEDIIFEGKLYLNRTSEIESRVLFRVYYCVLNSKFDYWKPLITWGIFVLWNYIHACRSCPFFQSFLGFCYFWIYLTEKDFFCTTCSNFFTNYWLIKWLSVFEILRNIFDKPNFGKLLQYYIKSLNYAFTF